MPDSKESRFSSGLVKCGLQQSACNAVVPIRLALIKDTVMSTFEFKSSNIAISCLGGHQRATVVKNGLSSWK